MTTIRLALLHLRDYKPSDHIALIIWTTDDVMEKAKERHLEITQEEAEGIVDDLQENHDASQGISWNTIDDALDEVEDKHEEEERKKMEDRIS